MDRLNGIFQQGVTRRDFIKGGIAAGVLLSMDPAGLCADAASGAEVWVVTGADKAKLMAKAVEIVMSNGGLGAGLKKLALKVNAGWDRGPETGANTDPEIVDGFLKGIKAAGMEKVVLPEHPCHSAKKTFVSSGIYEVAKKHGAEMIDLGTDRSSFTKVKLPKALSLKEAEISKYFLESYAIVNMPIAKHHGGGGLTMALKNWMGAVKDRGWWHKNDLHQCIADIATLIRPQWTIIDATKTMMDSGPQGPGTLQTPNQVIISKDQVAADAYAAKTLFPEKTAAKAKYIKIAGEMNAGVVDVEKMTVKKFEV